MQSGAIGDLAIEDRTGRQEESAVKCLPWDKRQEESNSSNGVLATVDGVAEEEETEAWR
jgi:hypothetical protein